MEKQLGKEYQSKQERKQFLQDNCDVVVEKGYMKAFSGEKIEELKSQLAETSIEIGEVEERKKASAAQFNSELKPLLEEKGSILRGIKERAEYVKEECYKFIDQDDKMVGFYNSEGDLIERRPAQPDEMQRNLFKPLKTGTND